MQSALWIVQQAQSEMGLPRAVTLQTSPQALDVQCMALLNSAGAELVNYYTWEELTKEFIITTVAGQGEYDMPADFKYFNDQTQWDRSNHWPLLGPKTGQEWQWIKGGLISQGPRLRYRLMGGKFLLWPIPGDPASGTFVPWTLAMEYVSKNWVNADTANPSSMVTQDADVPIFDEWLLVKFLKLKFWETKGFDTTAYRDDMLNMFFSLTGKNMGAPTLTLSPRPASIYIGPNNVPDGSWPVGSTI